MSTTNVTLRINSYQTKNRILSKEVNFGGTSKAKNCESAPILDCLNDFFEAVTSEVNDDFSLTVCGNVFEQALVRAEAERWKDVTSYTTEPYSVPWSSRSRLQFLKDSLGALVCGTTVNVVIVGNRVVSIPEYPLVSLDCSAARKLVVSSDLYEIRDFFEEEDCEPVAFWVGGHSCRMENGGQYIIGCTDENVHAMVCGYLETRYINPLIGELFRKHRVRFNAYREPAAFLLDRIDPYYFIDKNSESIKLFLEDHSSIGLHSVSMGANETVQFDSLSDLSRVRWIREDVRRPANGKESILSVNIADPRQIAAAQLGVCRLRWEFDYTAEQLTVEVTVVPHIYIQSIESQLLHRGQPITRWKLGETYDIFTRFEPKHAEDAHIYEYESSNPSVARVVDKQVQVLQEGTFALITKAKQASHTMHVSVSGATVKSISVENWPEDGQISAGQQHEVSVPVSPSSANWNGFTCEVVRGSKCASIVKRGNSHAVITAKRPGNCVIRFVSKDNPEVFCEETLVVVPDPPKPRCYAYAALFASSLGALLLLLTKNVFAGLPFGCIATFLFVVACLRREKSAKTLLVIVTIAYIAVSAGVVIYRRADNSGALAHKVTQESIAELRAAADSLVRASVYVEDPYWSKTKWHPVTAEYLGYVLCEDWGKHSLFLLYDVVLTNPDAAEQKNIRALIEYQGKCKYDGAFDNYNTKDGGIIWEDTFQDWLDSYTDNDTVCAMSFSLEEANQIFGWDSFVLSEVDITQTELKVIVNKCAESGGLGSNEVSVAAVHLFVSNSITDSTRNKLYVHLQKEIVNDATGESVSYYFPFCIENLKVEIDENGRSNVVLDDLSIREYDYVLNLEDSPIYGLDNVVRLDSQ